MIKLKTYSINNLSLTNELLALYINNFWIEIFNSIKGTNHLLILCKVKFTDEEMGYKTLGHLRIVNFSDKDLFFDYLSERLSMLNESYFTHPISEITFSYITKDGIIKDSNRALLLKIDENRKFSHNFNNLNLPITMDPTEYGEIRGDCYVKVNGTSYHRFFVHNGSKVFQIDRSYDKSKNLVSILGNIDLSWVDTKLEGECTNFFKREIKKSTIYFLDGVIVLRKQQLNAKPFKNLTSENKIEVIN